MLLHPKLAIVSVTLVLGACGGQTIGTEDAGSSDATPMLRLQVVHT
jgi:hypothetical protein